MKANLTLDENFKLTQPHNSGRLALIVGIVGLAISGFGWFTNSGQFFHSYLTAYTFWATIGLGALFFTLLHHLTNATWSVVVRRMSESVMVTLPLLIILFIPIIVGFHDLYEWSHTEVVAKDPILSKKAGYLNSTFFIIRTAGYFIIWFFLARILHRYSIKQDENGSVELGNKMRRISAPGMILFAITLTFSSFDWIMSLDAHWYSTIFGVYIFGGSFLAVLSFITLMSQYMRSRGLLVDTITVEHYNDLGKYLFAFTIFWAYIAFSQYFLIWYANIPEETVWFQERWAGSWKTLSLVLIFGHFVIPFFILMPRSSKRNLVIMGIMTSLILVVHWVDLYWLIAPNFHHGGISLSWMDLTTLVGIGGIFIWYFWRRYSAHALIPINDPKLKASLKFKNV